MLQVMLDSGGVLGYLMALLEDGGEMITLSLMVWYFFHIIFRPINEPAFLFTYFLKKVKNDAL
jgi:hypothetical protein